MLAASFVTKLRSCALHSSFAQIHAVVLAILGQLASEGATFEEAAIAKSCV
jgi:hypothetical protein